ncbi:hypothetical protein GGF42_005865 [Coemansia sp. RSA 2424]|nr:hypothetical protein GGF42_005865 [Coemansia sp. RSA 2424]
MAKKELATTCDNSCSNNRRSLNVAEAGSGGWWDDSSSDRSTVSGATLVGSRSAYSTTYGYGARPAAEQPSRVCSVDLEQHPAFAEHWQSSRLACGSSCTSQGGNSSGYGHFLQMRGCIPERSVSVRGKGDEFGSGAGVLRFVLSPHATFSGILEIIDCEDMGVAYRKISRDGRSWCETFHKVPIQAYAGACNAMAPASFSSVDGSQDYRQYRQQQQFKQRHPQTFELNQLWEMSSPCPTSFPLHCRDTRGIIDPIPMTALVADRLRFCYRFHLAGNKLKWVARPASPCTVELQCFARATLIATLQFGSTLTPDKRGRLQRLPPHKGKHTLAADAYAQAGTQAEERLPVVTVSPLAFSKLASVDADVIESFILFTGIEVLECYILQSA